ncbi:MAG: hypothetical protein M3P30_11495 [Chloroflexota bacterium]|nr:hypothetical protein [Chloroflexota bacterium]
MAKDAATADSGVSLTPRSGATSPIPAPNVGPMIHAATGYEACDNSQQPRQLATAPPTESRLLRGTTAATSAVLTVITAATQIWTAEACTGEPAIANDGRANMPAAAANTR